MKTQVLYLEPPHNFVPALEVVACFIKHEDTILFLERNLAKPEGGTWCVPGGKRDKHETLSAAMSREIYEETGLIIPENSLKYSKTTFARYPKFDFTYHLFLVYFTQKPFAIKINTNEHHNFRWTNLLEARNLLLTPGIDEALTLLFEEKVPSMDPSYL